MGIVGELGERTVRALEDFGDFCRFCGQSWSWIFRGGLRWRGLRLLAPELYEVGTRSIPVVMITGAFVGAVLAVQAAMQFKALDMQSRMGSVVNQSVLRELGPVLAGIMLAGRVGGGLAAELGTMRVTEQIDALRAMGADPLRVLVVPRFLACALMTPVLVLYASFLGIMGGFFVSVYVYGVGGDQFWQSSEQVITYHDILQGPIKAFFYGAALSLICCYKGFRCAPGAAGVGRAANAAFVISAMAILALDFFLGMLLNTLDAFFFGVRGLA